MSTITAVSSRFNLEAEDPVDRLIGALVAAKKKTADTETIKAAISDLKLTSQMTESWPEIKKCQLYFFSNHLAWARLALPGGIFPKIGELNDGGARSWYQASLREEDSRAPTLLPPSNFDGRKFLEWRFGVGQRHLIEEEWQPVADCF